MKEFSNVKERSNVIKLPNVKKLHLEEWSAVPSPVFCPESCKALREAEGILLAVQAGAHAGKLLEYCLEYLWQQDCKVTSVILWGANEKLIKAYYFGNSHVRKEKN